MLRVCATTLPNRPSTVGDSSRSVSMLRTSPNVACLPDDDLVSSFQGRDCGPPPSPLPFPQRGAADAEIKVPSGENTEFKRSPFEAWSRSVYSHTCYAYCQGFLPCLFLPFQSIHLHFFFQNLSQFFLCLLWLTHGSCVGQQNKIGHPAGCRFPC